MFEVRDDGVFPKPLTEGSSPMSTNFPERISSTKDCFRAGTPGATTTVSEALELFPPPVRRGRLASSDTPEELVGGPIETDGVVFRGEGAEYPVRALARAALCVKLASVKLSSPRLARALLAGIMPSPLIPAPVSGSVAVRCAPFVQVACEMGCQVPSYRERLLRR